jgi:radical SAM superfamily enzyme YgiQ (UPF0313 family)
MSVAKRVGADVDYTDKLLMADVWNYDVVGISCMTPQGSQAYDFCRFLKKFYPSIKVILGGPHATYYLDECRKHPFDIIVTGDGERVFEELLTGKVDSSRLLPESTPEQLVFHDELTESEMNSYIPYREKAYIDRYRYDLNGVEATTLINSRGCPMRCAFCESGGTTPRWYSPEHFEAEVKSIADLDIKGIMIFDDLFAMSINRTKPYLEILRKHDMTFRCFGHAKTMTPELAGLLSKSGCVEVGFGAESASQKILDTVKGTKAWQNHALVEYVISNGMSVKAFLIIGLPGETEETFKKTYNFIKKYRTKYPDSFDFDLTVFYPYKGTVIGDAVRNGGGYDIRLKQGLSWSDIDCDGYGAYKKKKGTSDIIIETSGLSAERIGELQKETILLR